MHSFHHAHDIRRETMTPRAILSSVSNPEGKQEGAGLSRRTVQANPMIENAQAKGFGKGAIHHFDAKGGGCTGSP